MTLGYKRQFQHQDWLDFVDPVQAGGNNGFNARFHALEGEFNLISAAITAVDDLVASLRAPVKLLLVPNLVATGQPWAHVYGAATKGPGQTSADGMMAIGLPDGATLQTFRAIGDKQSGNLAIALRRQALASGSAIERMVGINAPLGAFDVPVSVPASVAKVNNDQFRYFITAQLDSAGPADAVDITAFQIVHQFV